MKWDLDSHTSSRSLTHPAGNLNNKPAARNDHTTQPETEPALNRFALKPLVLGPAGLYWISWIYTTGTEAALAGPTPSSGSEKTPPAIRKVPSLFILMGIPSSLHCCSAYCHADRQRRPVVSCIIRPSRNIGLHCLKAAG